MSVEKSIVWGNQNGNPLTGEACPRCEGRGRLYQAPIEIDDCNYCAGLGWFGIDPRLPVQARPGSREKIAMLTVRQAAGVPLWNDEDGLSTSDEAADSRRLVL